MYLHKIPTFFHPADIKSSIKKMTKNRSNMNDWAIKRGLGSANAI